jgi:hypothetical protein
MKISSLIILATAKNEYFSSTFFPISTNTVFNLKQIIGKALYRENKSAVLTQFMHPSVCPGLPDAFFPDQKSQFGYILEDLGMENVVSIYFEKFFDHWEFSMAIW